MSDARGEMMNIPVNKIIAKMSLELEKVGRENNPAKVREHLQAIRTLCDLVLDEPPTEKTQTIAPSNAVQSISKSFPTASKLEEDDANGESLFDF